MHNLQTKTSLDLKVFTESKTITESATSKNLCEALPNINDSACVSTSLAQLQNCAIFAQQKSNKICSASAHTTSRPCRGVKNALKKCSSAFLAFLTRQGYSEALPPKDILLAAQKDPTGCKRSAAKTRHFILFRGFRSGEGINPLSFCANKRLEKLENIRENTTQRNLESNPLDSITRTKTESRQYRIYRISNTDRI